MAHRVLTVCGLKGGIGKSAVATNLAAWWSAAGQRVLLIDADPNGSATKLHARGDGVLLAAGSAVVPIQQAPMAMAKPWDLVVVDTAGGSRDEQRTYAEGSNYVLAPCQPAASSIEQVMDLAEDGVDDNLDSNCTKIFERALEQAEILQQSIKAELQSHVKKGKWG